MFDIQNEVLEWGGKKLTIETGRVARQAHGSVIATYGGTSVLATVVSDRDEKKDIDFFPLTVNYQRRLTPQVRFLVVFLREREDLQKKKL